MKLFAIPLITAFLAASSCSQAAEPTAKLLEDPISVAASNSGLNGNWQIVIADSHVKFTATQQGTEFTGAFETFDALINFKEDAIEDASVTANIDLGSVSAGDKDRDGSLPGKDWFYVKKFPKAVFQSDDFIKIDGNNYEARGTLTMKDKSQPLTLPFILDITGGKAEMAGRVTLDRTLWNVGTGAWATDEWVSTDVTVDVKISAETAL